MKRTAGLTLTALVTALAFIAPAAQTPAPSAPQTAQGPPEYDFLIKGGRVIDPRNSLDAVRDVAIKDGKIAAVAADIRRGARRSRPSTRAAWSSRRASSTSTCTSSRARSRTTTPAATGASSPTASRCAAA